jgi:hypothetical protein
MFFIGLGLGLLVGLLVGLFSRGLGKLAKDEREEIKKYLDSLPADEQLKHCGTCGARLED